MLVYMYFVIARCSNFSPTDRTQPPPLRMLFDELHTLLVFRRVHKASLFVMGNFMAMNYVKITESTTHSPRISSYHCRNIADINRRPVHREREGVSDALAPRNEWGEAQI